MGYRKTMKRLTTRVFWFEMLADIFSFVKTCPTCQSCMNPNQKPSGEMQPVRVNGPWDVLAMDLIGPLPSTKNRYCHMLVIVDHFSKWVEIFPLRNTMSATIAAILQNEIFCRWSSPKSILINNATYFRSKIFENMCIAWGIKA